MAFTRAEISKRYREAHPEQVAAYKKRYKAENREKVNAYNRSYLPRWDENNPGRRDEMRRKYYEANKEEIIAKSIRWKKANPWYTTESTRVRRERLKHEPITISVDQFAARWMYYGGKCWVCKTSADQWDHVKPVAKGGRHILSNLRPICGTCNRMKHAKWPFIPDEKVG
jgi:5-methylcytosine-specific restriction endonuclease McrA